MPVKTSAQLTLRDRLSRLTFAQACKWLGPDGVRLMRKPLPLDIDPGEIRLGENALKVTVRLPNRAPVALALKTSNAGPDRVLFACSEEKDAAQFHAALLNYVLEEKTALGLAEPPEEQPAPLETLDGFACQGWVRVLWSAVACSPESPSFWFCWLPCSCSVGIGWLCRRWPGWG